MFSFIHDGYDNKERTQNLNHLFVSIGTATTAAQSLMPMLRQAATNAQRIDDDLKPTTQRVDSMMRCRFNETNKLIQIVDSTSRVGSDSARSVARVLPSIVLNSNNDRATIREILVNKIPQLSDSIALAHTKVDTLMKNTLNPLQESMRQAQQDLEHARDTEKVLSSEIQYVAQDSIATVRALVGANVPLVRTTLIDPLRKYAKDVNHASDSLYSDFADRFNHLIDSLENKALIIQENGLRIINKPKEFEPKDVKLP